jgi:plastocyanin
MLVRRARTPIAVVIALLLVLSVAGVAQAARTIRGSGTSWSPASVTVAKGAVVKWRGVSNSHTVTAYGGNWTINKSLEPGTVVKKKFRSTGTFKFRCRFHSSLTGGVCSGMCGRIRVA